MRHHHFIPVFVLSCLATACSALHAEESTSHSSTSGDQRGALLQFGQMHQVIGMKQHHGRVRLSDLKPVSNLFAVGALEGLEGEITIAGGQMVISQVNPQGQLQSVAGDTGDRQATMLIGAHVDAWEKTVVPKDLTDAELDTFIQQQIQRRGGDSSKPIMFRIDGEFAKADVHVIHGACPVHARIRKEPIPPSQRPFEETLHDVSAQVVGVYAEDAVGKLTHPATRTHKHLIFRREVGDTPLTAHVELLTVRAGSVLYLPAD
ncbi:acetolactate decarboxylase [Crateriforma conspicua]|uniref:Uncharacterized protein n=1 Tax=Crateriforma conspicua TaxID=2527996 RepID=A0A5C6FIM5_9PLAN|nr:acetolactate decarboxylase [Crateriforma conspicua]TWU62105.1 hypothetical protein V7x_38340 [Crateriforma conspicua]